MQRLSLLIGAVFADEYRASQGLCKSPEGNKIAEWRHKNRDWCIA
jgi:putative hemolysin